MPLVRLITDPLDLSEYTEHSVVDLLGFLQEHFGKWPETARLYRDAVAVENDVTPQTEEDVAALADYEGDGVFYVVVYPGDPITAIITVVATLALTAAVLLFLTPKIPALANNDESSNNSLGNRVNKPRPNGRIPDIFGQVISIPELLTVPLLVFEDNLEREVCLMCVGRGSYTIASVKDGDTPLSQIAGAGAKFYGPGTSPNSGTPFYEVGADIDFPLLDVVKVNEVNGQVLRAPNSNQVSGDSDIRFVYPDTIERSGSAIDFMKYFAPGDQLTVSGSSFSSDPGTSSTSQISRFTLGGDIEFDTFDPTTLFEVGQMLTITNAGFADENELGGITYVDLMGTYEIAALDSNSITLDTPADVNPDWNVLDSYVGDQTSYRTSTFSVPLATTGFNLDGTYNIISVTSSEIVLTDPATINAAWDNLDELPGGATEYLSPSLSTSGERWVGPFVVNLEDATQIASNFIALQGMYLVTAKGKYRPRSVQVRLEVTPVDEDGVATGAAESFTISVAGDGKDKSPQGVTLWADPTFTGRMAVRARRLTNLDLESEDTIVDEVKWRDCYGTAPVTVPHFGNVTTVHTLTLATSGATSIKERKLNCRATRRVLKKNPITRTNLFTKGTNLGSWSSGSGSTTPTGGAADPFGGTNAWVLTDNDAGIAEALSQTTVIPAIVQTYTVSVYVKKDNSATYRPNIRLVPTGGSGVSEVSSLLNLTTGVASGSATVTDEGDFWRISLSLTNNGTYTGLAFALYPAGGAMTGGLATAPTGSTTFAFVQIETGTQATEYIPTNGSAVTVESGWDGSFGPDLVASTKAADIICHMALDPHIGNRTIDELDVEQIYDTLAEVESYFGIPEVASFNYTFDQDNVSFEEMVQSVAQCVFCVAYRQGSMLRLFFERATEDSTLLFNHRNKVPGSETRTVRFGYMNDNDGVEFDYISPVDGSKLTIYVPNDQSATKPKKLEVLGVQSEEHASLHAWRTYNKLKYQNTTSEFQAMSEATQLVLSERIEVADNTRADTVDGHVVSQDGLVLSLSQPFEPAVGLTYVIHLQLPTGEVEVIDIEPGDSKWSVVLQQAPSVPLVIDQNVLTDVAFQIVGSDDMRPSAFLLTEKGAYDRSTVAVQAINYDARYYQSDQTYNV